MDPPHLKCVHYCSLTTYTLLWDPALRLNRLEPEVQTPGSTGESKVSLEAEGVACQTCMRAWIYALTLV